MNSLEIKSEQVKSMSVTFSPDGKLKLEGASCDEDPKPLYGKLNQWIKEYSTQPASNTELYIRLKYFNSSSAKCILEFLSTVTTALKDASLRISWCYEKDDDDMLDSIKTFSELIKKDIHAVEVTSY